jgi:predicted DNA-binding transcriptional regulator AlpA
MPKKQPSKNAAAIQPKTEDPQRRWVRNGELAKYLGVSKMTLWRFKNDAAFKFPPASVINNIEFNDLDKIDAWMESHAEQSP